MRAIRILLLFSLSLFSDATPYNSPAGEGEYGKIGKLKLVHKVKPGETDREAKPA